MALTVEVTKQSVTRSPPGQWAIGWNLVIKDDAVEVFSQDFTQDYKKGDDVSRVETGFIEQMQGAINKYKKEQLILNDAAMDTAVTNVLAALEV